MNHLDTIPKSKRAYFVKKVTQLPSGSRNDPYILKEPLYYVMCRPVNPKGERSFFYGTKVTQAHGPFSGEAGRIKAEQIAAMRNETFHNHCL